MQNTPTTPWKPLLAGALSAALSLVAIHGSQTTEVHASAGHGFRPSSPQVLLEDVRAGRWLRGIDLRGMDLSGLDLSQAQLRGADLSRTILRGTILRGADLARTQLNGADLTGADLTDANLWRADLRGVDLRTSTIEDTIFTEARMDGSLLRINTAPESGAQQGGADSTGELETKALRVAAITL